MTTDDAKRILGRLEKQCEEACAIAKTAARNRKSLAGDNSYGNRFHARVVELSKVQSDLEAIMDACHLDPTQAAKVTGYIATMKSTNANTKPSQRAEALKQFKLVSGSVLLPNIENIQADPIPRTEQVLPLSVVLGTRDYFKHFILLANGCYEHQWFDACSVMIRKFVEIAIIHIYEHAARVAEVTDTTGNFLMLGALIDRLTNDRSYNLGRETKTVLPL